MPIYEYVCRDCGHEFEILVRGEEKASCSSCGLFRLTKRLSLPAAHVAKGTPPPCPAKETGACGVSDCCGGNCGPGEWMA